MADYPIINCHIHTFTAQNVPNKFLPFRLTTLLRFLPLRVVVLFIMRRIGKGKRDLAERYARLMEVSYKKKQEDIAKLVRKEYPSSTRFIVLPMDMEHMGAGTTRESLEDQQAELLRLSKKKEFNIIPFCAVDPRHRDVVAKAKQWIEKDGFDGIKIYPNLGYLPTDKALMEVYAMAEANGVPVMAHCSTGGVRYHGKSKAEAAKYGHPQNYVTILETFKKLRLCLAHFGGIEEWRNYLKGEDKDLNGENNWVWTIYELMDTGKYPNLYTDISYTMWAGSDSETIRPLKVLLSNDKVREHVLFGSDYYMVEREKRTEREVSMNMRSILGEALFKQLAYTNPKAYLGPRVSIP